MIGRRFLGCTSLVAVALLFSEAAAQAATYEPGDGSVPFYRFVEQPLTDRTQISVNVASGNLLVTASDLQIAGTGLDLELTRYYNSLDTSASDVGAGWTLSVGQDVRLAPRADGSVDVFPPSSFKASFQPRTGGGYTAPTGFHARLAQTADAFELTYNQSRAKYRFPLAGGPASSLTDKNGNRISFSYDGAGKLTSITDSQSRVHTVAYDAGSISSVTDSSARVVSYVQDGGDLEESTDAAGYFTNYYYDSAHRLTRISDPLLTQTRISYDATGRVTQFARTTVASMTGPTTTFAYGTGDSRCPAATTSTRVTDPNNNATVYCWDSERRVRKVIDARGNKRDTSYDVNSNVTELATGSSVSTATWLEGGRLESLNSPTGAKSSFAYSDPSHEFFPTSSQSAQGDTTSFTWQSNNLEVITDGDGKRTKLTYNGNGTIASSTTPKGDGLGDPNPYKTTYQYDAKGNLTGIDHPGPLGSESFSYDGLSRLKTRTDGAGRSATYGYDKLDRVTSIVDGDGSLVFFQYDQVGNRTARRGPEGDRGYMYDYLSRLLNESLGASQPVSYSYDPAGNLLSLTDGGGTVLYGYDAVNNVNQVTEPGGARTTFSYDDRDNRTQTVYPNGVTIHHDYDASDRSKEIRAVKGTAAPLVHRTYSHDPDGAGPLVDSALRQSEQDKVAGTSTSYDYDRTDRLTDAHTTTTATGATVDRFSYAYDANSNRTSETRNGQQTSSTYNVANQLQSAGSTSYSYDGAGNLLGTSAGLALTYNAKSQTATVKPPGGSALALAYGGSDQWERTREGATTFENHALGLGAKLDGSVRASYTRDDQRRLISQRLSTGGSHYYIADALGSIIALTDQSGTVVRRYGYDPYGKTTSTSGSAENPYRFAGEYHGAAGLYKIGMRYYDPATGRWTQQDPLNQITDIRQANRYAYAGCDPVNRTDPLGTSFSFEEIVVSAVKATTVAIACAAAAPTATTGAGIVAVRLVCMGGGQLTGYSIYQDFEDDDGTAEF